MGIRERFTSKLHRLRSRFPRLYELLTYATVQAVSYSILTVNFRAVASSRLFVALATDGVNATLGFFIIRRIARSEESQIGFFGYLTGSLIGTTVGMYLDRYK